MSRPLPAPIPGTLADAYPMDFSARTEDLPMWHRLLHDAPSGPTCEVGVGDGRVSGTFRGRAHVLGIEPDVRLGYRAIERLVDVRRGDASESDTWHGIPPCALVFAAWSTLFLMELERQRASLGLMARHLLPGGVLAVETFVPVLSGSGETTRDRAVRDPNDPLRPPWIRRTTYTVDADERRTRIRRLYGPDPGDWRLEVEETVWWSDAAGVASLFASQGLVVVRQDTAPPVPQGYLLTTWTRPAC